MTRLALVGLGAAARRIHLPACQSVPGLELVGGADPDPAARETFARATARPVHADAAALLAAERPDWVLVAAPPARHAELVLAALEHGAHVFCEKPFVESLADAERIVAASEQAGRVVAVNHEFPRMPSHAALLEAVGGPELGAPLFLQAWQTVEPGEADLVGWRTGAATMREFGTHVVDLAMRVFGGRPLAVTARMPLPAGAPTTGAPGTGAPATGAPGTGAGDLLDLVVLEFEGGRSASIVLDRLCRGRHRYLELRLEGERASLRTSLGGRMSLAMGFSPRARRPLLRLDLCKGGQAWIESGESVRVIARNPLDTLAHATGVQLGLVLDAVRRGERPPADAREARDVVEVVETAYAAAREGRTLELPPRRADAAAS